MRRSLMSYPNTFQSAQVSESTNKWGEGRTNVFSEHIPLEPRQILHRPNIISPPRTLFPSYRLCVEHIRNDARDFFVGEFDPAFGEVRFFGGGVFFAQVGPPRIYNTADNIRKGDDDGMVSGGAYLPAVNTASQLHHADSLDAALWKVSYRAVCEKCRLFLRGLGWR